MTDTLHTPRTAPQQPLRPFARDPRRWEKERSRALLTGHVCGDTTCTGTCKPTLVHERTGWGWLTWTVPGDGTLPSLPQQIGVLTPDATLTQRLAVRWLTRRPAHRIALTATSPSSLRFSAALVGIISLFAALFALSHDIPAGVVLPAMLLAPLLTEDLPDRLDGRARDYVRSVEGDEACQYLQRLAALHTYIVQTAAGSDCHELRSSAEIGQHLLWDAADLLQNQDTRSASPRLIDRERLMVHLADQVAQTVERTRPESASHEADQPCGGEGTLGPLPHGFEPAAGPTPSPTPDTSPLKGYRPMTQTQPDDAVRTTDVYLLFAHEPYYPSDGAQEINTTVVAAASLLHPQVQQPDGARIHDRLTQGRKPGEIIPLSTLTHELGGGADWPTVGDWEKVTTDLLQLVHARECDALSLGLPEIGRALVCAGPDSHVRAFDAAADEFITYGPQERAAVLAEVDRFLACLVAEQEIWPGDGLLPPLFRQA
ncbi:hypothetical protein [Streptomyces malaysiensis]|uniref:Uncharacterized protein n=1 Tax=Streptomyces malaysiensis subsp. samsunensis TaxID=459658 RepID=A0A9X2M5T8_STRMQ|nr:hypothetical protein [Streptomyces samsunensis]MCQ8833824.1 hypothetical protein [Streptomyces samsunensis]